MPNKNKLQSSNYFGLFTINAKCNDDCQFCIKAKFIKQRIGDLALSEIKKNYLFLRKKFKIQRVILSGGEPTLHPQIFKILDFFEEEGMPVHLVTNLLKFNDKSFFDKLLPYFYHGGPKQKNQIEGSINDLPDASKSAKLRMRGLVLAVKYQLPLEIITVIYKDNIRDLPRLVYLVKSLFHKYFPGKSSFPFISAWEFRSLYISETPPDLLKKSLPGIFPQFKVAIEKSLSILNTSPSIKTILWHLPLCYFRNFDLAVLDAMRRRINCHNVWVNKNLQLKKAKILGRRKGYKDCRGCRLVNVCTGMCSREYMERYNFPPFRPIKTM